MNKSFLYETYQQTISSPNNSFMCKYFKTVNLILWWINLGWIPFNAYLYLLLHLALFWVTKQFSLVHSICHVIFAKIDQLTDNVCILHIICTVLIKIIVNKN